MCVPTQDDENEDSDPPGTAEVAAVAAGGRVGGAAAETSGKERLVEEPLSVLLAGVLHQVCVKCGKKGRNGEGGAKWGALTVCEPKIVDVARLAAFTKRVATIAMDSGPAEALALLGCVLRYTPASRCCCHVVASLRSSASAILQHNKAW
eukprot:scaffold74509_cov18-Tisochrysis_lutea.AAC.1